MTIATTPPWLVARCEVNDNFETLAACKVALDAALREEAEIEGGTALLFDKAACIATDDPPQGKIAAQIWYANGPRSRS
jgi:hypothetical protein